MLNIGTALTVYDGEKLLHVVLVLVLVVDILLELMLVLIELFTVLINLYNGINDGLLVSLGSEMANLTVFFDADGLASSTSPIESSLCSKAWWTRWSTWVPR